MQVIIGKARVTLDDRELLGAGGEGRVYKWRDRAVKIHHAVSSGLAPADEAAARAKLALAIAKVKAFPRSLGPEVVAPTDVVTDARGVEIGFTMPLITDATEVFRLSQRKWREGSLRNGEVVALFLRLHAMLGNLHARGVVIGDFNDGNVLFSRAPSGALTPWLIDADSMQFGAFPCVVAHERFLDPRLYGRDLTRAPAFDAGSGWYAFGVMLFASLLYAHPYGGMHARFPTLLGRAEAGHSVLRADVVYPRAAVSYRILPDDLLSWIAATFDEGARAPLPDALLSMRWTRCACGLEHARRACPECAAPRAIASATAHGRCRATSVRRTRGHILGAAVQGRLAYLYEEDVVVRREDDSKVLEGGHLPGTRFAIAGRSTWVARGERLARVVGEAVRETASTATFGGAPAFDANVSSCFAVVDDWIVELSRGTRVGQVIAGQTWLRVGDALGIGFYRAGVALEHFLFHVGRGGLTRVLLPPLRGKLVDAAAYFDGDRVLFATAIDLDGRRIHAMHLVASTGEVLASTCGAPDTQPMLATIGGKCMAHGAILCATDDGLVLVRADPKTRELAAEKHFPDTRPFVNADSEMHAAPGGSVYVVGPNEITCLSLE